MIGNALVKGISGGQAKRTNIGIALITSPRVLFLDEVRACIHVLYYLTVSFGLIRDLPAVNSLYSCNLSVCCTLAHTALALPLCPSLFAHAVTTAAACAAHVWTGLVHIQRGDDGGQDTGGGRHNRVRHHCESMARCHCPVLHCEEVCPRAFVWCAFHPSVHLSVLPLLLHRPRSTRPPPTASTFSTGSSCWLQARWSTLAP